MMIEDQYTGGRYRNTTPCPNCGSAAYCRGAEVVDYCSDCKALFKDDTDEWSLQTGMEIDDE